MPVPMAINNIHIKNFRSIKELDLELGPVNALIGLNNSGKSNVLRALNLVLGETWPTRPFSERDFYGYDQSKTIEIAIVFDEVLKADHDVAGFCLQYSAREGVDYFPIDKNGDRCVWPGIKGTPKRVNALMRDERALLYLDLDRQAERQLRTTQWTLYGKLLRKIEAAINPEARRAFAAEVTGAVDTHVRQSWAKAQQIMNDFVRRQTGLEVVLDFRALDPLEVLKGVRPYVADSRFAFDPEDVGAGVQSAIAVAIAKAYAEIVRAPLAGC